MKRANPLPENKTAAIIPMLSLRPVKPIRLKTAQYRILGLALLCFLLPGYINSVNWSDCGTTINKHCLAVPVFMESVATTCEHKVTKLVSSMLNINASEIVPQTMPTASGNR